MFSESIGGQMDTPVQRTIKIGAVNIGLIGLETALSQAFVDKLDDKQAASFLFKAVSRQNYIPVDAAELYKQALTAEYIRYRNRGARNRQGMVIRILGPGCVSCNRIKTMTIEILNHLQLAADVVDIHELDEIWRYGVTTTPALLINDEVKSAGYLPTHAQIEAWIKEAARNNSPE